VTVNPATTPFVVADLEADKGTGRAVDVGAQIVRGGWEAGFGVNGIGNQIEWTDLTLKRYTLNSLLTGADFVEQTIANPAGPLTVELPIVSSGNVGYDGDGYAFKASVVHGRRAPRRPRRRLLRIPLESRGEASDFNGRIGPDRPGMIDTSCLV
jgi:hypothetical protein